jgi:FKBP-type peptidyl-prolyl cis-trans isomerase 2
MKTVEKENSIKVHYVGTTMNGNEFDNSYKRGSTLDFKVGAGEMIPGFDNGVVGMTIGETRQIKIAPNEAYGERRADAMVQVLRENFNNLDQFNKGDMVQGSTHDGRPVQATIQDITDQYVILDMNHPLAGETLIFDIELVDIVD